METNLTIRDNFKIYDNRATVYAPGVYNEANLYVADQRDITNGVYIENRSAVVQILDELPDGTAIQIDNSNYVYPDITKAPIVIAVATDTHPILTENDRKAFIKPPTGFENWVISLFNQTEVVLSLEEYDIEYFNLMGAINPNPDSYNSGTPTFPLLPPSAIPGYTFIGWFDENGNQVTEITQGSSGNLKLYARWEVSERMITHDGNDSSSAPATHVPDPILFSPGDNVKLSAMIPTRKGYLFLNWNTERNGTGNTYYPNEIIPNVMDNLTLYAQWFSIPQPEIKYICTTCNCICCKCRMSMKEFCERSKCCNKR